MAASDIPDHLLWMMRNDYGKFDIAPMAYITIITWCFDKQPNETFEDYIVRNNLLTKSGIYKEGGKNWLKKNKEKLQETDMASYDVTFLHELLHIICHQEIVSPGTTIWDAKWTDPTTVEYYLKLIKEFRNDVSHGRNKAIQDTLLDNLRNDIVKCLEIAASLYGVDERERKERIAEVERAFDTLIEDTTSSPERRAQFIRDWLIKRGREEVAKLVRETVPLADDYNINIVIDEVFHILKLSREKEDSERTTGNMDGEPDADKVIFSCSEILSNLKGCTVVLGGEAGSGKTTLMRKILIDILKANGESSENGCFKDAHTFTLPLHIECSSEKSGNLIEFARKTFPNRLYEYSDGEIRRALDMIPNLIFLVDGFDEVGQIGRELIDEVIEFCRTNERGAVCIISSRFEATSQLVRKLSKESVKYQFVSLRKITGTDEQNEFLNKYSQYFMRKYPCTFRTGRPNELVNAFSKLALDVRKILSTPIMLAIFCRLFLDDSVQGFSSARNAHDVYEALFKTYSNKMRDLIEENNWAVLFTPSDLSKQIMSKICGVSLQLCRRHKYVLSEDDRDEMVREYLNGSCTGDFDIKRVLSCVLSPEQQVGYADQITYRFPHLALQEYFAAKCVVTNLLLTEDGDSNISENQGLLIEKSIGVEIKNFTDRVR